MTELRRMALEQFTKAQAQEELREQRRKDGMAKHLKQAFWDTFLLDIQPSGDRHTIEDLTFTVSGDPRNQTLFLIENCSLCQTELLVPITSLAELGQHLEEQAEEPPICGLCQLQMEESERATGAQEPQLTESEAVILSLGTSLRQIILMAEVLEQRVLPAVERGQRSLRINGNIQE